MMEVEQFVSQFLQKISLGVNNGSNSESTFHLDAKTGIKFNLAVITTGTDGTESETDLSSIKVIAADKLAETVKKSSTTEVISRVEFTVMPSYNAVPRIGTVKKRPRNWPRD